MLACGRVISSALHGIILADALSVPVVWLSSTDPSSLTSQKRDKFNDYFLSIGRAPNTTIATVEEAHVASPLPLVPLTVILEKARKWMTAFPWKKVCS